MRALKIVPVVLAAVLLPVMLPSAAAEEVAQEALLRNITLSSMDDHMVVSLRVEGAFTPKILSMVQEGAQVQFTYRLRMYRDRHMWLDEKLVGMDLTHRLLFDPVRKIYKVRRSWALEPWTQTRSLAEARALMTQIDRLPILALDRMQPGEGYELRAKVELLQVTLPFYLRYVFYFVSFWDYETEWHSVFFLY
ncbi:MAG: DUF4390 domain-containing protein [Desulfobacterales bacterium]|nr:DUF4390 domain-containing protein [Desulfobacterales bacterium]